MALSKVSAPFPVTVGNIYFGDAETGEVVTVEYAKTVGLTVTQSTLNITGSGKITDIIASITGLEIALSSSRLPKEIVRKYRGQEVSENKGFSAINTDDNLVPFAFGFTVKNSNGKSVFNWLPNVTMTENNATYNTKPAEGDNDPVQDTTINAIPDGDSGDILVEYDQSEVTEGFTPLTEKEFFAQVISSMDDPLIDSEEAQGGTV